MSSNKKLDKDIAARINNLRSKGNSAAATDEEIAQRFTNVFSSTPIATQSKINYNIPKDAIDECMDEELEKMLMESDDEDDMDNTIYAALAGKDSLPQHSTMDNDLDGFQKAFMGSDSQFGTDESDALIRRAQEENALDAKYESFQKKKDKDIENRYLELKKDAPNFDGYQKQDKPKGSIPKALSTDDFYDEMDDWCCICNDDATVECEGCEDDNKYCSDCYFHTHRSESAEYEATKHRSKPYKRFL